jgi:cytoskeleton protein RodZ
MDESPSVSAHDVEGDGPAAAGALLREARERRALSVEQCANALRSRSAQILALERGDLSVFGGAIYARGFLRSYAQLVGLDAQEVLALHGEDPAFRGPILPPREPVRLRRDVPGWLVGLVGVLVVGGVVTAVLGLGGRRVPPVVPPVDVALDEPDAPDAAAPPAPQPQPAPAPPPPAPPARPPVDLVMTFEGNSWLEVLVDGIPVESGVLVRAGETLRFSGQQTVMLRLGNAGGVRIELNGEDLGPAGRPGQVLRVSYGPDGVLEPDVTSATTGG